ncbi:choice-of-anchor M domain-containing protein [Trueperella pyogenes]|uniref:choice-of-anchor M domain-containing protein n=1 Tax=Trueperella pyogenes TaxID=1661 RepID=UPI00216746F6|nr:choice-of-anchor M domain-containing protein [Trueperella pyogenes]UVJ54962.1 choice-of-anchor M domain-containing protein [Trueperella pyogenes]
MTRRLITLALGSLLALMASPALASTDKSTPDSTAVDPALVQRVAENEAVAPAGERKVIDAGHVDMGPRLINGQWKVLARDDTAATPTWRETDDVVYLVGDNARLDVPEGYDFVGGSQAWVIPQQEIAQVPWLGWNTQDPAVVAGVNGTVSIVFDGHEGPGDFTAFVQAGNFQGPNVLWDSKKKEAQPISVELNSHTHVNWAFTEPGVHRLRLTFTATLKDGTTVGAPAFITVAVGSQTTADQAWRVIDDAVMAGKSTATATAKAPSAQPSENASPTDAPTSPRPSDNTGMFVAIGIAGVAVVALAGFFVARKRTHVAQSAALSEREDTE